MSSSRVLGALAAVLLGIGMFYAGGASAQTRTLSRSPELPGLAKDERDLGLVEIDIKVDATGQLTALRPTAESAADLVPALEKAINGWRFTPARRDGEAVDWATRVSAYLKATPVEGGYALVVRKINLDSVWMKRGETMKIARYPLPSRRRREEAWVLVLATPHVEGGGADVLAVEVDGKPVSKANPFLQAASETVSGWPFEVLEWGGRHYVEQVCAPLSYTLDNSRRRNQRWTEEDDREEECRRLPGGLDFQPIKLAEEVVGRRL